MRTVTLVLLAAAIASGGCKKSEDATQAAPPAQAPTQLATPTPTPAPAAPTPTTMVPEHGGVVATNAGLTTEVVVQGEGKLVAYLRGPQGPVQDANIRVALRNADGTTRPVAVAWDAQAGGYVGYVWGVQPGTKTIEVSLAAPQAGAPPQMVSSQVNVAAVAKLPRARYGGTVELIGQYAVEILPARTGDVAFFVMDLQGHPVPAAEVELPRVTVQAAPPAPRAGVAVNAAIAAPTATVALVPIKVGDHLVAHADQAVVVAGPAVGFDFDLSVRGQTFTHAGIPSAVVMARMPRAVAIVAPAAPAAHVAAHANARVVAPSAQVNVQVPAPPSIAVQANLPPPSVNVRANFAPPPVVVAPVAARAAVVVAPPVVRVGVAAPPAPVVAVPAAAVGGAAASAGGGASVTGSARLQIAAPPPPPPPPRVNVQGGFQVGGSIGLH